MTTQPRAPNTVILEQVQHLRLDITGLADQVKSLTKTLQEYQLTSAAEYARSHEIYKRIDTHEIDIKALQEECADIQTEIQKLCQTTKMLLGIISFIGVGAGTWLMGQLLGLIAP